MSELSAEFLRQGLHHLPHRCFDIPVIKSARSILEGQAQGQAFSSCARHLPVHYQSAERQPNHEQRHNYTHLMEQPTIFYAVMFFAALTGGGDAFARTGTKQSTGTRLFCLSGNVQRPGVYEVPFGMKLDRLIEYARGHRRALVLTHDNPDPDSIAAGVALAHLLEKLAGVEAIVQALRGRWFGRTEYYDARRDKGASHENVRGFYAAAGVTLRDLAIQNGAAETAK